MFAIKLASYRKKDWNRLMNTIADRESMHDNLEEWYDAMQKSKQAFLSQGFEVFEVTVKLDELKSYCESMGLENNGKARSQFVQTK